MVSKRPLTLAIICLLLACRSSEQTTEKPQAASMDGIPRRGGKIILLSQNGPDYLDPGLAYLTTSWEILPAVNNGLLA